MRHRSLAAALAVTVVLPACITPEGGGQRQAEAIDDGVQLTGRLDGARVAISDGGPEVAVGDCDPRDGLDEDVCWVARTIDGATVAMVIENPAVLEVGERIPIRDEDCTDCDDVTDHAVVDVRLDGTQRRATAGHLNVRQAGPRYAASFRIDFDNADRLTGTFNVRRLAFGEQ